MNNPKGSSKKNKRTRDDDMLSNRPLSQAQDVVHVQLPAQASHCVGEISKQAEDKPSSSMRLRSSCHVKDVMTMSEDFVQDQIIIAPEIMNMILKHMDFQSLKRARLVCKSWHREAREHLERRGLVRLNSKDSDAWQGQPDSSSFIKLRQQENQALPQAFRCMEVKFPACYNADPGLLQSHISSLCPLLVISRFDAGVLTFELAFRLVTQFASSLEFLKVSAKTCQVGYKPTLDPKLCFPKLLSLAVDGEIVRENPNNWIHFPSTIARIVKASPNLERYECKCKFEESMELASELLLQVDVKSVKELVLIVNGCNRVAFEHFLSIPFSQLQKLSVRLYPEGGRRVSQVALIATAAKSTATLKSIDILNLSFSIDVFAFPICPNIKELRISYIGLPLRPDNFPSLEVLDVLRVDLNRHPVLHRPLPGLKTLRVYSVVLNNYNHESIVKFLENYPGLERLRLDPSIVLRCCRLKANGHPRLSNFLEGVKHLEFPQRSWHEAAEGSGYGFLSVLKGIETLKLLPGNKFIESIPIEDMPSLRVIEFPFLWDDDRNMSRLLEIARGVETVIVTDCCHSHNARPESKELLKRFFESAPNAKCGCKDLNDSNYWPWF